MAYPQLFEVRSDKIYFDGYEVAVITDANIPATVTGDFIDCIEDAELPEEKVDDPQIDPALLLEFGRIIMFLLCCTAFLLPGVM